MVSMDVFKMTSYALIGFEFQNYRPQIALATVAGLSGSWLGKRVSHQISEQVFRTAFRIFVSLVALRLIAKGLGWF